MTTSVLVTGANGFVGSALCGILAQSGYRVRAGLRQGRSAPLGAAESVVVGDLDGSTDWSQALKGIDCVVHAAARAHVLRDSPANASLYLQTNAQATQHLAAACGRVGVGRFIYLSSIKVNGEATPARSFTAADAPAPLDDYGVSKLLAEQMLFEVAAASGMEVVVIRPPLVYGPGVRANFLRLMSWVYRGMPLPFGAVSNARSMVSVWNLCDLIQSSIAASVVPEKVLLVSDGMDLSTPELIRKLAGAMNLKPRLLSVPVTTLRMAAKLTGKSAEISRLLGSLRVDISATRRALSWAPSLSVDEGLARTVHWYVNDRNDGAP